MTPRNLLCECLLLAAAAAWPQNGNAGMALSLYVKTSVYPSDSADRFGHGKVEATFRFKDGAPLPNQEIQLSTTNGVFSCNLPDIENEVDSATFDESCCTTGKDGRILVYLTNIPFNSQGMVTASCTYGDVSVKATSTFWIKRMPKSLAARKSKIKKQKFRSEGGELERVGGH
jgi:hypothetical protein